MGCKAGQASLLAAFPAINFLTIVNSWGEEGTRYRLTVRWPFRPRYGCKLHMLNVCAYP